MYNDFRKKCLATRQKTFTEKEIRLLKAPRILTRSLPTKFSLLLNSRKSSEKDISPENLHFTSLRSLAIIPMCLGKSVLTGFGNISKMKLQSLVNFIPDISLHVRLRIPNS